VAGENLMNTVTQDRLCIEQNLVNFNAKTGDVIAFPNGRRKHRVLDSFPDRVRLAELLPDGTQGIWVAKYGRILEAKGFFVEAK
jgi:hypothetical protein